MKTRIDKCDLTVTTKKNALPTRKPIAGRFKLSSDLGEASFEEDANGIVIYGEPKSTCLFRRPRASVWWHPDKKEYKISIRVPKDALLPLVECDYEECINFIKRRKINEEFN